MEVTPRKKEMATGRHISLPKPFASGDVNEWCQRFEICSKANEWNNATMALKLPTLLEGEALAVWMELTEDEQKDYKVAKEKMVAKMAPMGFVSLEEFHRRKLQPGESVSVYVHDLKRLLDQAMPKLDKEARDDLVLHQFMAGLPTHISTQLRATGDTKKLDDTVERARLLMSISPQAPVAAVESDLGEVQQLRDQITELTEQVAALTTQRPTSQRKSSIRCFNCDGIGHIQRDCPSPRRRRSNIGPCNNCGRFGHLARSCHQQSGNGKGTSAASSRRPSD